MRKDPSRFTFGNPDWDKNFDFPKSNDSDLLSEINKIYVKSQSQSQLTKLKETAKSTGSLFGKKSSSKKMVDLSEIMEEKMDEQTEVDDNEFMQNE